MIVDEFANQCQYYLNMSAVATPNIDRPATPDPVADPVTYVQWAGDLYDYAQAWDNVAKGVRNQAREERARGASQAPPVGGSPGRRKFPLPGKYEGKIGDTAMTFMTQCQNYLTTEGR